MKKILKALINLILKGFVKVLKAMLMKKLATNKELRVYIGATLKANVTLCNIKGDDGEISKTIGGTFNNGTTDIKINIICQDYMKTLLHECVHYRQWQLAEIRAKRLGVEPLISMGVNYNKEYYLAEGQAEKDVVDNPHWTLEYKMYYLRPHEIEARMMASKLYK
ncbi:MAG: hypothetical protein ACRC0F_04555 [Cetobacterium sp.]